MLEAIRELEHLAVPVREGLLPDDGDEPADVLPFRVRGVELVRDLLVILPRPVLADPGVHQSGQGRQRVDRRIDRLAVQVPRDRDLPFRNVPRQVRDRVGPVVVRDGHDRDLGDAALPAMDAARPLVHRGQVRVRVPGVSASAGDLFAGRPDLSERLRVVRHVRHDDEDVHADLVGEILRGGEGHSRGDEPLDRRVVGQVQEQDGAPKRPRAFEVVHEDAGLLMRDAHRRKHHAEGLLRPEDLRLAGNLQCDLVVRQARAREERQLLASNERVEPVDRRDAGLDELRRMFPRIRIDRGSDDLDPFLRDDRRPPVDRFARAAQDPAEHVPRHVQFDRLAEELDRRLPVDPRGPFEHLDDNDVLGGIQDLSAFPGPVGQPDLHELAVADPCRLLDEDQRPRDFGDCPVFRWHLTPPPAS